MSNKGEDEADTTTRWEQLWPGSRWVLSGTRVWASEPHAKTGTSDETEDNDDAKPVMKEEEKVDALEKLKKDKDAMMRRIIQDGEDASTKAFALDSGLNVVLPSKKDKQQQKGGRRTRGKLRAKSRAKSRKKRRRKRGGTRKNAGPEKPIVGYYYRINIYHGGQGEKVLQYGNVIGKYLGLAEEFHDGFQGEDKKKLMFRTPHITDDDGPRELTGEIISKIGPSITYINGGRRKKRTKKRRKSRRKSKGRKRRRKNLKKRTKRRR